MAATKNCGATAPGSVTPEFLSVQSVAERKHLAALTARAAMTGCTLHKTAAGWLLLREWSLNKALPYMRAVCSLLRQIGGRHV